MTPVVKRGNLGTDFWVFIYTEKKNCNADSDDAPCSFL